MRYYPVKFKNNKLSISVKLQSMKRATVLTVQDKKVAQTLGKNFVCVNFPGYLDKYISGTLPDITSHDQAGCDVQEILRLLFQEQ